ncbi:spoonbill [Carabus blaptoides fortunei]
MELITFLDIRLRAAVELLLVHLWSLPTVAILLSFLWYKRKRNTVSTDPAGIDPSTSTRLSEPAAEIKEQASLSGSSEHVDSISGSNTSLNSTASTSSPSKPVAYSRSLSGVDSAPIDIKSGRSAPLVISDTELDIEIEKIKSMKTGISVKKQQLSPMKKMSVSPLKLNSQQTTPVDTPPMMNNNANMSKSNSIEEVDEIHHRGCSIDRDSANHSPVDTMLPASPSLSSVSDNQSDSDSGKGGSDVATPPPAPQQHEKDIEPSGASKTAGVISDTDNSLYEFVIAQQLVGRLIGRHGAFVHHIREKTNARILIKRHPDTASKLKVCAIEGTPSEVDAALSMIRDKFPIKRYPELSLERVSFVPIVPDCMHLRLVEGVNNDTIVSCVVTPMHLFLQQPTHPTFPSLNVLTDYMNACYSESNKTPPPQLPEPVLPGTICAAHSGGTWYRSSVISVNDEEARAAYIQFLDYGGYATVPCSSLRQIRGDFLLLPFQAAECLLANVSPVDSEDGWSQEAYDVVVELTRGAVVFTQVVDYLEEDGATPLVHIYVRTGNQRGVSLLNRELVDRGYARWTDNVGCAR